MVHKSYSSGFGSFPNKINNKKYKVTITRETYVDAKDEDDAKILAYDSLIMGDVDFKVEEDDET